LRSGRLLPNFASQSVMDLTQFDTISKQCKNN